MPSIRTTGAFIRAALDGTLPCEPHDYGTVPDDLADSWRRSMALGISPDQHSPRHLHDAADAVELRREHRLQQVMPALNDLLADDSSSGRHLLVLTDARGEILWRVGSPEALRRADRLEFAEGADWSEAGIGTNAISEALVTGRPAQLFSAEHLVRTHHEGACTAAPITDPLTGELLGVLDVSGPLDTLSADTLRMVRCAVRVAEALLGTPDGGTSLCASPSVRASRQSVRRPGAAVESQELLGDKPSAVRDSTNREATGIATGEGPLRLLTWRQREHHSVCRQHLLTTAIPRGLGG
ncbi:GAF domain-containing protein [Pseudarthrobacter sulfonivorans]|uniref:GAF domain-containing protein n=1 Tax=Pseudarthrobacter sulfonivorans TaxID=121292 RepID=UPI0027805022|nr:GAF domain-containing protein [Pseudarthrobacter sulfonivorans]MDP9998283.1 transcriptional regulator of acetoin/glycerol metabolism [Pseudarthrobacter sulfonivorans]